MHRHQHSQNVCAYVHAGRDGTERVQFGERDAHADLDALVVAFRDVERQGAASKADGDVARPDAVAERQALDVAVDGVLVEALVPDRVATKMS